MTATATRVKITIEVKPFSEALAAVAGIIPSRSPKPILQNFLFRVDPEAGSELMATDLELSIRHRVLGVRADAKTTLVLDPRRFGAWLRATRDEQLDLHVDGEGGGVEIRGRSSKFELSTEDPDLFPTLPEWPLTPGHMVKAADLRRLIRRTAFATDPQSTRYALGGTLWEREAESLTLIATDGRRLALATAPAETAQWSDPGKQPVVHLKALRLIDRVIDDLDESVLAVFDGDGRHVFIRTERATIVSRLVEGRFPRYQDVFPGRPVSSVPFEAGTLLAAVEQASIATSEESRGIDFHFADGRLKVQSRAADVGAADIEMDVAFDGKPLTITFDGRYLAEALKTLEPDTPVDLELIDEKTAAVIRTKDGYSYVVMPLTREAR
jgi:DNA polymerase-3 subunit beta